LDHGCGLAAAPGNDGRKHDEWKTYAAGGADVSGSDPTTNVYTFEWHRLG
jgi:hypothetical protein